MLGLLRNMLNGHLEFRLERDFTKVFINISVHSFLFYQIKFLM